MSAGISRQQMVTVCLLNFNTMHLNTLTHTRKHRDPNSNFHHKNKTKNPYTFSVPYSHLKIAGTACHLNANTQTHAHTLTFTSDKSLPLSTMTSVPFPTDDTGTADDRLIVSLSHTSLWPLYHRLAAQSICWKEKRISFRPALTTTAALCIISKARQP